MLTGEYNHSIDSKGRLIIPAKFREILGDSFVITKGLDNCLFVYPDNEWKLFEEKLRTLPLTNKNARTFTRFFLGSAVEGVLDKQGRVLISSALRDFAGLEKEVVLVGVLDRVEIWDKAKWDESNAEVEANMDDIAGHMEGVLDKQGRVLISSALRDFAGLEKEVVLVGVLDRVEIWDKAKWDESNAEVEANMDDIAGHMEELGLGI